MRGRKGRSPQDRPARKTLLTDRVETGGMRDGWARGWAGGMRRVAALGAHPLRRCRRATVAIEYGLLSGVVAIGVTVGAGKLGASMNRTFTDLAAKVLF